MFCIGSALFYRQCGIVFPRYWLILPLPLDMDIFQSRFYRVNVTLLSMIGLWPYQMHKSWQILKQIICQFLILTVMMSQGVKLIEIWGDLDIMIECLTPMGVQLGAVVKSINCTVQRKKMVKLLNTIERDWSDIRNEKEIEILMRYAQKGRTLTMIYTVFLYGCLVLYLMIPLLPRFLDIVVPLNESRANVYLYQTQYYIDPEKYFVWICLHTYSGTIITVTSIIATDAMFFCLVMHVCGILAIIGYRLETLIPKCSDTNADYYIISKNEDNRCHREIVYSIHQHSKVTEVAQTIESSYSMSYLAALGIAVFLLSISAVQLLIKLGQVEEVLRLFLFNMAQFNHLLFNSWPCQKLIDESVHFRESLYTTQWYLLSTKNQHLLRFVMLRTLEPLKITAGKLYIMSMENFGVVIQSSMSYFTVFASIR